MEDTRHFRLRRLKCLRAASSSSPCSARSSELLRQCTPTARAVLLAAGPRGPNLGLVEIVLKELEWHDAGLLQDLIHGFPLIGDIPVDSEAPPSCRRTPLHDREALRALGTSGLQEQLRRQSRPLSGESLEDAAELWAQTLAEVRLGRMSPPQPVELASPSAQVFTRRFAVRQATSSGSLKVRCIDDFAESGVNDACRIGRRIRMGRIADLVQSARCLRAAHPSQRLLVLKSDVKAAYRSCPIRASDIELAGILVRDPQGRIFVSHQYAMPFGAVAAVYAWDRLGAFLAGALTELFHLPVCRYVDDMFLVDFGELAAESRSLMLEVVALLGFTLEESKTPAPASSQDVLGVQVTLRSDATGLVDLLLSPEPRKVLV